MENETRTSNAHDISIAVMQKDVEYIKNSLTKIETTLAVFDRNFARKDELKEVEKLIKDRDRETKESSLKIQMALREELSSKVEKSEFLPIQRMLSRLNWMIISGVSIALLSLIIKTQ